MNVKYNI